MVVLSFSVLKDKVLDGTKTRTMRRAGSKRWAQVYHLWIDNDQQNPMAPRINLQVYWKQRSPEQAFLFNAVLKNITKKKLGDLTEEEWLADGFQANIFTSPYNGESITYTAKDNGIRWFTNTYRLKENEPLNFEVFIIEFERVK